MPCYEIIAAGTHSDRAAALAHSEALRAEAESREKASRLSLFEARPELAKRLRSF